MHVVAEPKRGAAPPNAYAPGRRAGPRPGLQESSAVRRQKQAYLDKLQEQEHLAIAMLERRRKEEVDTLREQGETRKRVYNLHVEQQARNCDWVLSQQQAGVMQSMYEQYNSRRQVLEHGANQCVMDYHQLKTHDDMLMQEYQLQRGMFDSMRKYDEDMSKIQAHVLRNSAATLADNLLAASFCEGADRVEEVEVQAGHRYELMTQLRRRMEMLQTLRQPQLPLQAQTPCGSLSPRSGTDNASSTHASAITTAPAWGCCAVNRDRDDDDIAEVSMS